MKKVQRHYIGSKTITVGGSDADIAGFDSNAMQVAADALRGSGGVIRLSEGVFDIWGPVRLSSGVHLTGAGRSTVLKKTPFVSTGILVDVDYGVCEAVVADPLGFRAGTGIRIADAEGAGSWSVSTSKIVAVEGNTLHFDRRTIKDYARDSGGVITNDCSMIEVIKAENVRISNLTLDGSGDGSHWPDGCRIGAVYLHKAASCSVENVLVERFDGDGISWQITEDIAVKNCAVRGCSGYGMHPGTGSLRTIVEGSSLEGNEADGMFVCWRVQHGVFRGNTFTSNGWSGVCIGHRDTDNLFEGNVMRGNGRAGVRVRDEIDCNRADRNIYRGNTVEDNGDGEEGYGFLFEGFTEGTVLERNTIRDTGSGKQRAGVACRGSIRAIRMDGNLLEGHSMGNTVSI